MPLRIGKQPRPSAPTPASSGPTRTRRKATTQPGNPFDRPDMRQKLIDGDPQARGLFYENFFPRVFGYVRRLVRNEHLAEDLTQDIFLHIYRSFPSFDVSQSLRPWVYTIATRKVYDYWRSREGRSKSRDSSLDGHQNDSGIDPLLMAQDHPGKPYSVNFPGGSYDPTLSDVFCRESSELLKEAFAKLKENHRQIIILRDRENLSFSEISARLGRSEEALRKRYSRAQKELRKYFPNAAA